MATSHIFLATCKQCKAFCCTLARPPVTEKERHDILKAGFKDYFIKTECRIYDIKEGDNKQCPYLKHDYSCEIHHVKPKLCKTWPVIPRYRKSKRDYIVVKCPLFSYLSEKEIKQAKKEAETIPLPIIEHLWNISPEMKKKYKVFEYEEI